MNLAVIDTRSLEFTLCTSDNPHADQQASGDNEHMVTASYDGSVRRLNAQTGTFEEIFATYDESDSTYLEDLGFGLDQGYRYWTQSVATDHRYKDACLFVSTSLGDVFHVDLRKKQKMTFHETVSDKKINSVRCVPVPSF